MAGVMPWSSLHPPTFHLPPGQPRALLALAAGGDGGRGVELWSQIHVTGHVGREY